MKLGYCILITTFFVAFLLAILFHKFILANIGNIVIPTLTFFIKSFFIFTLIWNNFIQYLYSRLYYFANLILFWLSLLVLMNNIDLKKRRWLLWKLRITQFWFGWELSFLLMIIFCNVNTSHLKVLLLDM